MEAELKFEKENISGIAVVGSYLIDAAKRLGVDITDDCGRLGLCDSCAVTVTGGAEFLSAPTKAELEQLSEERRNRGERLSCQAKITGVGEIVIRTHEKKDPRPEEQKKHEEYRKEFDALPLDQKISRLMELEAVALGETLSFILNSPYTIGGKIVDILSGFGFKIDKDAKEARKPEEHRTNGAAEKPVETAEDEAIEAEEKQPEADKAEKTENEKTDI
ncbi:MAG TPA: 2Fe-2S iron-sulfur cluster-binding protein [Pyrinomonadaceae bacterium]|jgi:ferredoxin